MKSRPFVVNPDMTGQALLPIKPEEKLFSETWLQNVLNSFPQILPVDEIESVFWPLVPIGREINTSAGFIDNLFISKAGYLVMVETKLWRNPQAKREVLAQAIDYASELAGWSFEELEEVCQKQNSKGVLELIQTGFDPDSEEMPTEENISDNLRLGRFLILVVSDHIHHSLIKMLKYANNFPHLATNVGLIELHCYKAPNHQDEIIVVPSIIAKTEIVERSIVQVNLAPDVKHTISVEQIKSDPESHNREPLSEDEYWRTLQQNSLASVPKAKEILDHFSKYLAIELKMRRTAIVARMDLKDTGQRVSLFFIGIDGRLTCWPPTITEQLQNVGFERHLEQEYVSELSKLLKQKSKSWSIYAPVKDIDVTAFIKVVDDFIQKISDTQVTIEND